MTKPQRKQRPFNSAPVRKSKSPDNVQEKESAIGAALQKTFSNVFYQHVPAEDVVGWAAERKAVIARSMCDWGAQRKKNEHKVRVFNPDLKRDGWQVPHTVIEMVNDDMPFIIDSVTAALSAQGYNVEVLLHPILKVARGRTGVLTGVRPGKDNEKLHVAESYVYIHLEQVLTTEACHRLEATLDETLHDVRAATRDWRVMVAKIDSVVEQTARLLKLSASDENMEALDFLRYLKNNNFTFLGYREYKFTTSNGKTGSKVIPDSCLGILSGGKALDFGQGGDSPEVRALKLSPWPVMITKLIDLYSSVHRRVPMDAIAVKIVNDKGQLTGMHLFVGLFTSSTYSCRTNEVPIVRQKVRETIENAGFIQGSHDYKTLENILEKMPRDELFQVSRQDLLELALGILRLQAKLRIALFTHLDPTQKYMSCLLYVPRDRYNTAYRMQATRLLEQGLNGKVTNYFTTLDDSPLARLLFTIRFEPANGAKALDHATLEQQLVDLGREWDERLKSTLLKSFDRPKALELAATFGRAFSAAYEDSIDIDNAVHDIRQLDAMMGAGADISVDIYRLQGNAAGDLRLKVYHRGSPVPLSDILPVLENMGLSCLSEMPYEVSPAGYEGSIWIHDFVLAGGGSILLERVKPAFEEAFLRIWGRQTENDGLNQMVLKAGLNWEEVRILRTYSGFMRQARLPFSRTYIEQVLAAYPDIVGELINLFKAMHDPATAQKSAELAKGIDAKITDMLQLVQKLDHDRILRVFRTLIERTLRTSYFQRDEKGQAKAALAMKLDSKNIPDLPMPRPHVEIFIYSPRVEGVHLRGGPVARGGIRWSDRHDDFRTEVLGLMKSQMVKNTVIVPVGAKGGFIVKQPPKTGGREAYFQEGIECYKIFIQALLDLTDNNVKGKPVRPADVVCHDGFDPYLVVAADKGTATFSDIANSLSLKAGFWLGDAFASGGSAGYDHKKMGITARGGWEAVKRHFREMGKDIQKEPFTLAGVGDMGGDVFGNGLLLSKQMKLIAAFNHVHIFCDPEPDIAKSYAERKRLFKTRGGWDAYDKSVLSAGGAVFERSAKVLKLSPQIRKSLGISEEQMTPDELIRVILKSDVELIWFGGIGTYVKSSRQSHADADDKANDSCRVDAAEIRAKVIGEGANMGVTQLARIEFARQGGKINTDFIDNSAGVDCSDHEVNIKILLADVASRGKLALPARNKLLAQMTDDVAELVLRDNYQQTQSLSLQLHNSRDQMSLQADLIRDLEKANLIRRHLEGLPDEEQITRLSREGMGLTRPELAVLTSWAKIVLNKQLVETDIPDDKAMENLLFDYFPKELHKYKAEILNHKLRREIIATQIVNNLVNRMGAVFVPSRMAKTGASAEKVIRAFIIVQEAYGLQGLWKRIEALDGLVPGQVQIDALNEVFQVAKRVVTWLVRFGGDDLDMAGKIATLRPGIESLRNIVSQMIPADMQDSVRKMESGFVMMGMPAALAEEIASLQLLSSAGDIVNIAHKLKGDVKMAGAVYYRVGEYLGLDWLRLQLLGMQSPNRWQARVISGLLDEFYIQQAALTSLILADQKKGQKASVSMVDHWFGRCSEVTDKVLRVVIEMKSLPRVELEMLMLASQRVGYLVHQGR